MAFTKKMAPVKTKAKTKHKKGKKPNPFLAMLNKQAPPSPGSAMGMGGGPMPPMGGGPPPMYKKGGATKKKK